LLQKISTKIHLMTVNLGKNWPWLMPYFTYINGTRRRYVVKHNLITEVYLCLTTYLLVSHTTGMTHFLDLHKWSSASTLCIYCPIWVKSGITDLCTLLLSIVLNENWHREGMKLRLCMYHQAV